MGATDLSPALRSQVLAALEAGTALKICGGDSKHFLGRTTAGQVLSLSGHHGIVDYDPRELVLTARAGTRLAEIEETLAQAGQMLAFEPPRFGARATLGGTMACGLSGPRRPYRGAARDAILGCRLINGRGEVLRFGGQVMKNVAGYDVSRLMVGAYGTLGILLEISVRVWPRPTHSLTLMYECGPAEAIERMCGLSLRPLPVDGACFHEGHCYIRVSGAQTAVQEAHSRLGGEPLHDGAAFWEALREHRLPFFACAGPLYRIVVKPHTPPLAIAGDWLLDWGGAQRWLASPVPASAIRRCVAQAGGHVTRWRAGADDADVFEPLTPALARIHRRVKDGFDPGHVFNPGRTYPGL
ncbi:MAG: glycolate oxidase subunit GlcE [Betaproteobacteria bacterium]|nr:glycolate oxidase subunit GlcE [Betaproteobacteria bacterium]